MERRTFFVDVLLPLHLPGTYTYRVPFEYNDAIRVGQRVVVQFGTKRLYSALVRRIHETVPPYVTKYVLSILDLQPIVNERQFAFWEWMAAYYMCYPGDVMAVAMPSAFRLSSESYIVVHPDFAGEYGDLGEEEIKILDALSRKERLEISEVAEITGFQKIMPLIKSMIERHIILMDEELKQRYTPRRVTYLVLNEKYRDENELKLLFDTLEKRQSNQKQLLAMMHFMQLSGFGANEVKKKELTDNKELSASAIDTLIKKEILVVHQKEESRLEEFASTVDVDTIKLNDEQQTAFETLQACDKPVSLLHGVTSSGKTEVYIRLMDRAIKEGKQVLFLLPVCANFSAMRSVFTIRDSTHRSVPRCGVARWIQVPAVSVCWSGPARRFSCLFTIWVSLLSTRSTTAATSKATPHRATTVVTAPYTWRTPGGRVPFWVRRRPLWSLFSTPKVENTVLPKCRIAMAAYRCPKCSASI